MLALRNMINGIGTEVANFKELGRAPENQVRNFRNDMYLVSESLRLLKKNDTANISATDWAILNNYKRRLDYATKFIPTWVKVASPLRWDWGRWWAGGASW
jgi:PiT family inorganic phosphate transporter